MPSLIIELITSPYFICLKKSIHSFLQKCLNIWDYRDKPFGIEFPIQVILADAIISIEEFKNGILQLFITQSMRNIIENNDQYIVRKEIFHSNSGTNRDIYIQPDLIIYRPKSKQILEILEIKCIKNFEIGWALSPNGTRENIFKGDISRLLKIKYLYPEIETLFLIINRGNKSGDFVDELLKSKGYMKPLFANLIRKKIINLFCEFPLVNNIIGYLFVLSKNIDEKDWIENNFNISLT